MKNSGAAQTNLTPGTLSSVDSQPDCQRISGSQVIIFSSAPSGQDQEIYRMNRDGTGLIQLTNNTAFDTQPSWCGNGNIVFISDRDGGLDVYTMDQWGGNPRRLTCKTALEITPSCSPDAQYVVYSIIVAPGISSIARNAICPDTCCDELVGVDTLTSNASLNLDPVYSPGGTVIAFTSNRLLPGGGDFEIYKMDAENGDDPQDNGYLIQLTTNDAADLSPDWGEITP